LSEGAAKPPNHLRIPSELQTQTTPISFFSFCVHISLSLYAPTHLAEPVRHALQTAHVLVAQLLQRGLGPEHMRAPPPLHFLHQLRHLFFQHFQILLLALPRLPRRLPVPSQAPRAPFFWRASVDTAAAAANEIGRSARAVRGRKLLLWLLGLLHV